MKQSMNVGSEVNIEALLQTLEQALPQKVSEKTKAKARQLLIRLEHSGNTKGVEDKIAARVLDYIGEHYLEPLSLRTIAEKFHRAPAHLTTRFRKATGLPVMECVLEKRMDAAKYLLEHSSQPVRAVAEHIGYTDLSLFSRQFRRRYGVSPSQWRKSASEKKAKRHENEAIPFS